MRFALRCALLAMIASAAYVANMYTDYVSVVPAPALAQLPPIGVDSAAASATSTPVPADAGKPTPLPTPTLAAGSADAATATGTATAMASPPAESTPVAVATPMPPSVDLPPLSELPDEPDKAVAAAIDVSGGNIASKDGRVDIEFPAGAVAEPVDVTITRKSNTDYTAPSPDRPSVAVWDFRATSSKTAADVHKFAKPLTVTIRFSSNDMEGFDARNLMLWTFDDAAATWLPVAAQVDARSRTLVAASDHFTVYQATSSELVDTAPLLDGKNVDLHSGAASFSLPLQLPPGRGGLTPPLNLSYSSARVGEMRTYAAGTSWVGAGWDLDVPNIQFQIEPHQLAPQQHRAFLSLGALGGEMMQPLNQPTDPDGSGYIWYLRDNPGVKIRSAPGCGSDCSGPWTIWDQNGTKYVFGDSDAMHSSFVRFYREDQGGGIRYIRAYRMDVQYIQDIQGNRIDFTYWQVRTQDPQGLPGDTYVLAAYPQDILYNGGQASVSFHRGCDETPASPYTCMRFDTPRNVPACGYYAPEVLETQRLNQIEVKVSGTLVRRYDFTYQTDAFALSGCTPTKTTGTHRLLNVKMLDRSYTSYSYTTTSFQYTNKHHAYLNDADAEVYAYDWPHLTRVDNAFGGIILFAYQELGRIDAGNHWSRSVVTEERHQSGASQPDVYTSISYGPGPDQFNYPNPLKPTTSDTFNADYRGFNLVTESDAVGNKTKHYFYTTSASFGPDEVRTGREYDTIVQDAPGGQWQRTQTTWSIRPVSNLKSGSDYFVNFVDQSQIVTTLKDNTALTVANTYDDGSSCLTPVPTTCYGLVTQVDDQGESVGGERVLTKTAYHKNTTRWLFPPKYVEKLDADNGNALISCDRNFYDDANSANTLPTQGLLTAQSKAIDATSAQCEGATAFTSSTNTYSSYDAYGNVVRSSVATSTAPETQSAPTAIGPIQVFVRAVRVTTNDNNNVKVFIRSRGVDAESAVKTLTTSWGYVSETFSTDPATGGPWIPAAVAELEAGARNAMGPSGGGGVAVTQVYITTADGQTLRPTANGAYLEWGEQWGTGTTHWDRVAEVTPDDFGSYIMDNSWNGTERDTFQIADPTNSFNGRIPAGVSYSQTAYDSTHHVFPTSETNVLNQTTTVAYDYVLGKPTSVTEPSGLTKTIVYDNLGRLVRWYDNLDSDTIPTVAYQYTWGAVPNATLTQTRTVRGDASALSSSLSCLDGFGREFEHRETYNGANLNSVRTDYDARGNKIAVSNAVDAGTSTTCTATPTAINTLDRTLSTYDPLGHANLTMSIAANQTTGPYSQSVYNGKTTTLVDEKGNRTDQVTSVVGRTLTTSTGTTSTFLRPLAQGFYSQWSSATPNQAHYLNVREVLPDDDASRYSDQTSGHKDTQAYPGAGLPTGATILKVSFKFRWKPGTMWAIFRQGSGDTRSPSQYSGAGTTGWRNDQWDMTVNPSTGAAWTAAELNAGTEFGFENVDGPTYITQTYVDIVTQTTPNASTIYHYDGGGNLIDVTDAALNKTTVTYDFAGRKLSMSDPDMGPLTPWTYSYNAAGSLTSQTDARGITTSLGYDALERLYIKSYSNGDAPVSFLYDTYPDTSWCTQPAATAVGKMTRMSDASGQQLGCFDVRGRTIQSRRTVDGETFDMATTYPTLSQPNKTVTYPGGDVVSYNATTQGTVTGVSSDVDGNGPTASQTLLSNATPKPWGAIASLPLGNGSTTNYTYDYRTRLTNIQTGTAQNLTLTYDDASNVATLADSTGTPETLTFSYDGLNRLVGATGFAGGLTSSYVYDSIGNMTTKQEGTSNLTLNYPNSGQGSVRPHAVSTFGNPLVTLTYDANGNLATQGSSSYAFDSENRLTTRDTSGGNAFEYRYDGSGTLVKRIAVGGAQTVTLRPNAQGSYSQWNATPNVTHYLNVDETTADDDTTYLDQSLGAKNDTHLYPSAGVPSNAVIDKVTLKFRWKATGASYGALVPVYYQGGVMGATGNRIRTPAEGWINDSWELRYNPATKLYWTPAEVNASMEFGFRTYYTSLTPRVTQAYVEVTYRVPADSTVYIGGVYEKKSDGSVTKYYGALGKTIAVRQVPAGGGQGSLYYPLNDHLGSVASVLDSSGVTVSTQKYWPYGATRSGGVTQTDKLYTSQQIENSDAALGLYNYKARFYSTTLGRFVSADPIGSAPKFRARQTSVPALTVNQAIVIGRSMESHWRVVDLQRYTYAANNPLAFTDPTGLCILHLECTPSIALNTLACAHGLDACQVVANMMGIDLTIEQLELIVAWSKAAVRFAEFWVNFARDDINPFYNNKRALLSAYHGTDLISPESAISLVVQLAMMEYEELFPSNNLAKMVASAVSGLKQFIQNPTTQCIMQIVTLAAPYAGGAVGVGLLFVPGAEGVGVVLLTVSSGAIQKQTLTPAKTLSLDKCQGG